MKDRNAQARARENASAPPLEATQWWNPPMMNVAFRAGERCAALNGEVLRFASDRLRRDSEFGFALAKCRSWTEAAELQRDWATKTTEDYFEESRRLLKLATQWSADMVEASTEEA
ncbi:phasin family protein [Dongia deserti]|uniref:phasin family protein n=1 Tax=Dongia deserti TaxID=2268030 RepID=UPI000E647858|nr:phasin family protein [Dongia deserti]